MSGSDAPARAACWLCSRPTFDPDLKERQWVRGVSGGRQVLVCPQCQVDRPGWSDRLERCERCDGTRLSVMLGDVVCRQCGLVAGSQGTEGPAVHLLEPLVSRGLGRGRTRRTSST